MQQSRDSLQEANEIAGGTTLAKVLQPSSNQHRLGRSANFFHGLSKQHRALFMAAGVVLMKPTVILRQQPGNKR